MADVLRRLARYRKGFTAAVTALAWLVAHGYLHGQALTDANAILAAANVLGVVLVPNAPADLTEHPAGQHTA